MIDLKIHFILHSNKNAFYGRPKNIILHATVFYCLMLKLQSFRILIFQLHDLSNCPFQLHDNNRNNQFDDKYFIFQSLIFSLILKSIFNLRSNVFVYVFVYGENKHHGLILNSKCCIWL